MPPTAERHNRNSIKLTVTAAKMRPRNGHAYSSAPRRILRSPPDRGAENSKLQPTEGNPSMNTTPGDDATTWRDLADQLTAEQIAELEYLESEQLPPGIASPQNYLNHARKLAELNLARSVFADIAPPGDARNGIGDWIDFGRGLYQRMFTAWESPRRDVAIFGMQFNDGRVERHIVDRGDDDGPMTAQQAREKAAVADALDERERAAALTAAAAELERIECQR